MDRATIAIDSSATRLRRIAAAAASAPTRRERRSILANLLQGPVVRRATV